MRLDIDPKTHPAWTGIQKMIGRGGQLDKFNSRFAAIAGVKGHKEGEAISGTVNKAEKKVEKADAKKKK
jgi:hypothetical protein